MFWGRFEPSHHDPKVGGKLAELVLLHTSSLNEVASEFFSTNAPDPLHWIQNSCFGGRFEPFCYRTKVGAKPIELVPLANKFTK
jgi:hypothetical protein